MKSKNGQMMIELLFGLTVVVMILVALMTGTVISLRNARYSKNMTLSNHYAQQAMEKTRAYRNRNDFSDLVGDCSGNPCCYEEITPSTLTSLPNCTAWGSIDSVFRRKIEIDDEGETDRKKVTTTICWMDSGCGADNLCETEIVGYLSRWEN